MDAFLWALEHGDLALIRPAVDCGRVSRATPMEPGESKSGAGPDSSGALRVRGLLHYLELARAHVRFTAWPRCYPRIRASALSRRDVGIFPSIVKEAGPLVFLEALASGCFPLGTNFGGMKAGIDAIADTLPPHIVDEMRVDPEHVVTDIAQKASAALRMGVRYKDVLARAAQERHDWTSVGRKLARELRPCGGRAGLRRESCVLDPSRVARRKTLARYVHAMLDVTIRRLMDSSWQHRVRRRVACRASCAHRASNRCEATPLSPFAEFLAQEGFALPVNWDWRGPATVGRNRARLRGHHARLGRAGPRRGHRVGIVASPAREADGGRPQLRWAIDRFRTESRARRCTRDGRRAERLLWTLAAAAAIPVLCALADRDAIDDAHRGYFPARLFRLVRTCLVASRYSGPAGANAILSERVVGHRAFKAPILAIGFRTIRSRHRKRSTHSRTLRESEAAAVEHRADELGAKEIGHLASSGAVSRRRSGATSPNG